MLLIAIRFRPVQQAEADASVLFFIIVLQYTTWLDLCVIMDSVINCVRIRYAAGDPSGSHILSNNLGNGESWPEEQL